MDLSEIRAAIEEATGTRLREEPRTVSGGCIHEALQLGDYFIKLNTIPNAAMFEAEEFGLEALRRTNAVRVPQPVCSGRTTTHSFLVLEFLPLGANRESSQEDLGRQLAALHRTSRPQFGWDRDNFIGSTPQPNPATESWIEFLREQRLGYMVDLATARGFSFRGADTLLAQLPSFFGSREPTPSLLHGDLWGGNAGALTDGTPVIFDPAVYYGDREADLAMTTLFGGFGPAFYRAYEEAWPLDEGHEDRRDLYNLYHILNHAVLFGSGYARQAQTMIDSLLARI